MAIRPTSRSTKTPGGVRSKKQRTAKPVPSLLDRLIAIGNTIPDEELRRLPRDAAKNLDHYLDGSPKQP